MTISFYADKEAGGIRGWHWIDSDSGAWDGPKMDWEQYHLPNIQKYVKNFRTVIQAGGNLGMYPRLLSHTFERVITFEPDHENFICMTANCMDRTNVFKYQAAIGSDSGSVAMDRPSMGNVGMHNVFVSHNSSENVIPMIAADSFGLINVDLIMLDLEGYELDALWGLENTICDSSPVVFVERPTEYVRQFFQKVQYIEAEPSSMDVVFIPNL